MTRLGEPDLNHQFAANRSCKGDLRHYAHDVECRITWPPEVFDWLCWTGSDAITPAPFPVIFKSFSAPMLRPIGRSLFLHACPVFDLICKECRRACVRHYVGSSSCRLMRFVAMCVACGHPLAPDPQSAICQRKMPFFLFNAASGEKSSFSLPRLLSGLVFTKGSHWKISNESFASLTFWLHLRLNFGFVHHCLLNYFESNRWFTQQPELQSTIDHLPHNFWEY